MSRKPIHPHPNYTPTGKIDAIIQPARTLTKNGSLTLYPASFALNQVGVRKCMCRTLMRKVRHNRQLTEFGLSWVYSSGNILTRSKRKFQGLPFYCNRMPHHLLNSFFHLHIWWGASGALSTLSIGGVLRFFGHIILLRPVSSAGPARLGALIPHETFRRY